MLANEFEETRLEFSGAYLTDNPMCLTWCGSTSIYFAVKNDYFYVRIFEERLSSSSSGNVALSFLGLNYAHKYTFRLMKLVLFGKYLQRQNLP